MREGVHGKKLHGLQNVIMMCAIEVLKFPGFFSFFQEIILLSKKCLLS